MSALHANWRQHKQKTRTRQYSQILSDRLARKKHKGVKSPRLCIPQAPRDTHMQSMPAQVNNIGVISPRHANHPSDSHPFHAHVPWIAPLRLPRPQGPFPLATAPCDADCAAFCAALLAKLSSFVTPQRPVQRCGRGKPRHRLRCDAKAAMPSMLQKSTWQRTPCHGHVYV